MNSWNMVFRLSAHAGSHSLIQCLCPCQSYVMDRGAEMHKQGQGGTDLQGMSADTQGIWCTELLKT